MVYNFVFLVTFSSTLEQSVTLTTLCYCYYYCYCSAISIYRQQAAFVYIYIYIYSLDAKERHWIWKLETLTPKGLNVANTFYSQNRSSRKKRSRFFTLV